MRNWDCCGYKGDDTADILCAIACDEKMRAIANAPLKKRRKVVSALHAVMEGRERPVEVQCDREEDGDEE